LQALRLHALDYLLKPVEENHLVSAVKRVHENKEQQNEQIKRALKYYQKEEPINLDTPFGIKEGNKIHFVPLKNISHCQSDGNFTSVQIDNDVSIYSSFSLRILEERVPAAFFFRPHREYLINKHQIRSYDKADGGSIIMTNGKQIPLSRGRREEFLKFIS